jgi:hypothetical protein
MVLNRKVIKNDLLKKVTKMIVHSVVSNVSN